ncbi:aminoglycoside adenylyltransferase domain-containing protein [Halobacillus sp. A5]|uniref:aminoglycoside adenylyltransferase domain-containing protein n=1 Tax=Halobacillus sp. A5 TaxID=2880263 RepID=UPI0020A675D0|nr:aminoglycoside adenylyltransferase domain-containing protein [Halobacillus sp. A5]MCP3029488.1 DUF4111 domain-containing protein [Halobacillus sp. A5]
MTNPINIEHFVLNLLNETKQIIGNEIIGFYLHGSLAMGGFNPGSSDIDLLVVTNHWLGVEKKKRLAELFLRYSGAPYPIEISFLHKEQVLKGSHPFPFDFHYSECWRERYAAALSNGSSIYINEEVSTDPDLAAHIQVLRHRGVCLEGEPIAEVFPVIPPEDYLSSIMGDYEECVVNIERDPIYCTLNMLRVLMYLKTGAVVSKEEAGEWGMSAFPEELVRTIEKAVGGYRGNPALYSFDRNELLLLKEHIQNLVSR